MRHLVRYPDEMHFKLMIWITRHDAGDHLLPLSHPGSRYYWRLLIQAAAFKYRPAYVDERLFAMRRHKRQIDCFVSRHMNEFSGSPSWDCNIVLHVIRDGGNPTATVWTGSANFADDLWRSQENNFLQVCSEAFGDHYETDFSELRGNVSALAKFEIK